MRVITKQSKVVNAIAESLKVYPTYRGSGTGSFFNKERYERMSALDPMTCTVAEFEEAIQTITWTYNRCDECQHDFDTLVYIGEEEDYEARWQCLCKGCLSKAIEMLDIALDKEANKP